MCFFCFCVFFFLLFYYFFLCRSIDIFPPYISSIVYLLCIVCAYIWIYECAYEEVFDWWMYIWRPGQDVSYSTMSFCQSPPCLWRWPIELGWQLAGPRYPPISSLQPTVLRLQACMKCSAFDVSTGDGFKLRSLCLCSKHSYTLGHLPRTCLKVLYCDYKILWIFLLSFLLVVWHDFSMDILFVFSRFGETFAVTSLNKLCVYLEVPSSPFSTLLILRFLSFEYASELLAVWVMLITSDFSLFVSEHIVTRPCPASLNFVLLLFSIFRWYFYCGYYLTASFSSLNCWFVWFFFWVSILLLNFSSMFLNFSYKVLAVLSTLVAFFSRSWIDFLSFPICLLESLCLLIFSSNRILKSCSSFPAVSWGKVVARFLQRVS